MTPAGHVESVPDQNVLYMFGVARAPCGRKICPARIDGMLPDVSVEAVAHADLRAFVSAVPASQFGADELRSSLLDTRWLKDRILAHERVLEELRRSCDVVPFRFGSIYRDAGEVSRTLARHRAELSGVLDRIRNASEWGVKVYCDKAVLGHRVDAEPGALRDLRAALADASPGIGFFLRKKHAKARDDAIGAQIAGCVRRSRQRLVGNASESVELAIRPACVDGHPVEMVMSTAFLVAEKALAQFRQMVVALQREFAVGGFSYEVTGPWPPYHFVSLQSGGAACGDGAQQ